MKEIRESESEFVAHIPCDACGSSDANSLYDDGHTYCYACTTHVQGSDVVDETFKDTTATMVNHSKLIRGSYSALPARALTVETCRKFDYQIGSMDGKPVQIANYRNADGEVVAQKIRDKNKNFTVKGEGKAMQLYGSHLFNKGKRITICEGEIDAMTVAQVQNHKWPAVSLPNGAASAEKSIKKNWDYINSFDEIILMFDQDPVGQAAAQKCAELLPIGKVSIATLPRKDANECLLHGEGQSIISAIFTAVPYRPDGIIGSTDLRSIVSEKDKSSDIKYPFEKLNKITKGLRTSTIVTVCAGSGVGKSTFVREIFYHLHQQGEQVGMVMLEETVKRTLQGFVGVHMNKNITVDTESFEREEILKAFDELFNDKRQIYLYDHFGSNDFEMIKNRIRFMAKAVDCRWICLDHVSILVSSMTAGTNDERRLIDSIMTELRVLCQELDIGLILVSHLKRPDSEKGHEGGAQVHLSQLRGSHALAQLSDQTIALQKDPEDPDGDTRSIHVLKNRHTGEVGYAGTLKYDRTTGRLIDAETNSKF